MSKITLGFIATGKSLGSVLRNGKPTVFYIEEEQFDLQNNHAGWLQCGKAMLGNSCSSPGEKTVLD